MKKLFLIISISLLFFSCVNLRCINKETAFGLDGKASLSCDKELRAKSFCNKHEGLKEFGGVSATCNDGTRLEL
jgi:hypothetical protein